MSAMQKGQTKNLFPALCIQTVNDFLKKAPFKYVLKSLSHVYDITLKIKFF